MQVTTIGFDLAKPVMWLSGSAHDGLVHFGLSVPDTVAGANAVHGILAALVQRGRTGKGALVETSLLESLLDLQFEVLGTYMNDGGRTPERSAFRSAQATPP
jgi:crotonobetainyl-CoA:carnitine CoA-transferase CaiB-like acyl-CoA transferase